MAITKASNKLVVKAFMCREWQIGFSDFTESLQQIGNDTHARLCATPLSAEFHKQNYFLVVSCFHLPPARLEEEKFNLINVS